MYAYNNSSSCNSYSSNSNDSSYPCYPGDFPQLPPLHLDSLIIPNNEYDTVSAAFMMKQEQLYNYTTTSSSRSSGGCSSYASPTSLTQPSSDFMMQRSASSQSFQNHFNGFQYHQQLNHLSGFQDSGPVRKAFSTGDLERINMVQHQHRSDSPLSNESSIIECMNAKACKYSPEEKREKIEKYRNKRNLRNFNKKIKYECRKTLADRRPRIRGRFAKNSDESENGGQMINEWKHIPAHNHVFLEQDDENWIDFLDAFSSNLIP